MSDLEKIRSWFTGDHATVGVYILYSAISEGDLSANLGLAEYSYFFVREIFRAALEKHARVIVVTDPPREVDRIHDECQAEGTPCVFLSFAPPHRTFLGLRCPTIPVFAWEFDTIPDEVWSGDPRDDWRWVLTQLGSAITHSQYSARAIKAAMGSEFPVVSIPAPAWDAAQTSDRQFNCPRYEAVFAVHGVVYDARVEPVAAPSATALRMDERRGFLARVRLTGSFALRWYREVIADLLPSGVRRGLTALAAATYRKILGSRLDGGSSTPRLSTKQFTRFELSADEVVYTSVFNPHDGRKNWHDLVTAFCTALSTHDDATLVLKFVHHDCTTALAELAALLARIRPHRCRVIAVTGYLDNASYRSLVERTTFIANCSLSEGQCLPLMEFMSSGKPAIATENTAMAEYIGSDVAFVVGSSPEPCCWPHDVRNVFRAHRYRVDWQSLVSAFNRSYAVAKEEPALYAAMAGRASGRLRDHCSEGGALEALSQFLGLKEDHTIRTHSSAPVGPAVMTDDVLPRLAAAGYFSGAALPKLESDYDEFDPSRDHDARQLVEKFGIVVRGDALSTNRVYLHKGCGRLAYASTFTFHGGGNVVVLGELNGFHGSLTFEGRDSVVALMGHHQRLALDATLYQRDTLICGRGVFAWGLRVWVQGGTTCTIGDDCLLSENISIRTTDHHSIIDLKTQRSTNVPADIDIGRHVWIGPNCVVNKGVKIGDGSILATNTVVTGSIPSTELWGGIPARQIRKDVSWVRSFPPDQAEVGALFRVLDSASIPAFGKGGA